MFRKIAPGREQAAMAFLAREPELNHFILGDIECYTLADPNLDLWVEGRGEVTAALMRYYGSYILYAPEGADWRHAARIMRDTGFGMLSGKPEVVQPVLDELKLVPVLHGNVLMKLSLGRLIRSDKPVQMVKVDLGNLEEYLPAMVALRQDIPEFAMALNADALRDELRMGCKRIFIAVDGGVAVSMSMTTVERQKYAMIVSVCTRCEYRGRGYAGALMTALCEELEQEGKTAVLFYSNPVAGRIYRSLGFEDIGRWCFATFG